MLTYLDLRVSALVLLSVLAYMWNRHWSLAVIGSTFITCRYGGSSSCSNIRFLRRTDTRNSQFANTGSRVLCGGYEPKQPSPSNEDSKPRRDTRQLSVTVSSVTYSSYCSSVTFDEAHIYTGQTEGLKHDNNWVKHCTGCLLHYFYYVASSPRRLR